MQSVRKTCRGLHRRGQPPKFTELAAEWRQQILSGKLAAGAQLPSRAELARQFDTTKVTVQRAMDVLRADGLVTAVGGSGTFVASSSESRFPVALILAAQQHVGRSRFLDALNWEAQRLRDAGQNLIICDVLTEDGRATLDAITQRVLDHTIAGLIFTLDVYDFQKTPLLDEAHIPRIRIGSGQCGVPGLEMDMPSRTFKMYAPVLDYFARRGRHRIALLRNAQYLNELADDPFAAMAGGLGLEVKPWWVQGVPAFEVPDHAERITQLMMQGEGERRPDALFIADDNLVPYATRGLLDAGVRVPEDLDVVAHASFPWPTECHVAARRIGFDADALLGAALNAVEAMRRGDAVAAPELAVRWED